MARAPIEPHRYTLATGRVRPSPADSDSEPGQSSNAPAALPAQGLLPCRGRGTALPVVHRRARGDLGTLARGVLRFSADRASGHTHVPGRMRPHDPANRPVLRACQALPEFCPQARSRPRCHGVDRTHPADDSGENAIMRDTRLQVRPSHREVMFEPSNSGTVLAHYLERGRPDTTRGCEPLDPTLRRTDRRADRPDHGHVTRGALRLVGRASPLRARLRPTTARHRRQSQPRPPPSPTYAPRLASRRLVRVPQGPSAWCTCH